MTAKLLPPVLAVLGAAVPLTGGGFTAWGIALAWLTGLAAVAVGRAVLHASPQTLLLGDLVGLVLTLVVLAPEGGWWFVPAVAAQSYFDWQLARRAGVQTT